MKGDTTAGVFLVYLFYVLGKCSKRGVMPTRIAKQFLEGKTLVLPFFIGGLHDRKESGHD